MLIFLFLHTNKKNENMQNKLFSWITGRIGRQPLSVRIPGIPASPKPYLELDGKNIEHIKIQVEMEVQLDKDSGNFFIVGGQTKSPAQIVRKVVDLISSELHTTYSNK